MARSQRTHRAAIDDFWRTSHHDGRISIGEGGGCRCTSTPCQPITMTYKVAVYALSVKWASYHVL